MNNPIADQQRQDYLEWLYHHYGRTCETYTGLYQQRIADLVKRDMETGAKRSKHVFSVQRFEFLPRAAQSDEVAF